MSWQLCCIIAVIANLAACVICAETVGDPSGPALNWQSMAEWNYLNATEPCDPSDPFHCFGNGECDVVTGFCDCNIPWRGPECTQLDLLPAKKAAHGIPMNGAHPNWGGAIIQDQGKWKMLLGTTFLEDGQAAVDPVTTWNRQPPINIANLEAGTHPFNSDGLPRFLGSPALADHRVNDEHLWEDLWVHSTNNDDYHDDRYSINYLAILESTTDSPLGPWTPPDRNRIFRHGSMRVDIKRHPQTNALLVLYQTGMYTRGVGSQFGWAINHSASGSMDGPWEVTMIYDFQSNGHAVSKTPDPATLGRPEDTWDCYLNDPCLVIHPNGSTVIAYRGTKCNSDDHTETMGIITAEMWNGTYTRYGPLLVDVEDCAVWTTDRGTHKLFHHQKGDHLPYSHGHERHRARRGGYGFSVDGLVNWKKSEYEVWPGEIRWDDGTTWPLLKQQRPHLVFADPTKPSQPTHLMTGVDYIYDPCCTWYIFGSAWTLIQPLVTDCKAGHIMDGSDCRKCQPSDVSVASTGQCLQTTSKYGECVCAVCDAGFRGDFCEKPPMRCGSQAEPQETGTFSGWSARYKCNPQQKGPGQDGHRIWFGSNTGSLISKIYNHPSIHDPSLCKSLCEEHALKYMKPGCCSFFDVNGWNACFYNPVSEAADTSLEAKTWTGTWGSLCLPQ